MPHANRALRNFNMYLNVRHQPLRSRLFEGPFPNLFNGGKKESDASFRNRSPSPDRNLALNQYNDPNLRQESTSATASGPPSTLSDTRRLSGRSSFEAGETDLAVRETDNHALATPPKRTPRAMRSPWPSPLLSHSFF